jgi:hypothetical protein
VDAPRESAYASCAPMRALDFALRLAFFAIVPFLATLVAALFPMTAVLVNVVVALVVFAAAEIVREHATKRPIVAKLLRRHLEFEEHYRRHPPRPFLFYVFYPLLLPYVLWRPETRRELWLYRGLTGGGLLVLVAAAGLDFFLHWLPEIGFETFIVLWLLLFAVQTLCIFLFLLPVATTVVKLHAERRFVALWVLLGAAAISVSAAVVTLEMKRGHIVSWATTERVRLRTRAAPKATRAAQLEALHAVFGNLAELKESTDKDGWVEGDSIDRAEEMLETVYKADEAYAFSLHALPAAAPTVLVLQCDIGKGAPIWRAVRKTGEEITSVNDLPAGVLGLKRRPTRQPPKKRTGWHNAKK